MERLSFYLAIAFAISIGSVNAAEKKDVVDWTEKDWNELMDGTKTCTATKFRPMADPAYPSKCPDGYKDDDGALLCYEECPKGWTSDGLTMCYEDCKSGYKEIAGVCWSNTWKVMPQGSKGRGVGVIPNSCGAGKTKEGGLCYDNCPGGWKPFGCHCWKGLKSRGRGCGSAPKNCPSSHPLKQSGLCYKACPAGYPIAEGPVCWESCQNTHGPDAIDTGAFCEVGEIKSYLQERYFRKSKMKECSNGELDGLNCYEKCDDGYSGSPGVCWNDNLDNSIAAVVLTAGQLPGIQVCYSFLAGYAAIIAAQDLMGLEGADLDPFLKCAWPLLQTMDALDDSWDSSAGVTVAVVGKVKAKAPVVGVEAYGGLAFEFKDENNVDIWGFAGGCGNLHGKQLIKDDHLHPSFKIGISGGMAIFRSVNDIRGAKTYLSMGVNIFGIVDAGSSWAFDNECRVKGMTNTVGVSCGHIPCIDPIPVKPDISTGVCINFDTKRLGGYSVGDSQPPAPVVPAPAVPAPAPTCDLSVRNDGAWFSPLDIPGYGRTVASPADCRQRCLDVADCYYFNNFPNGGCHLSGKGAKLDFSKKKNPTKASGAVRCESVIVPEVPALTPPPTPAPTPCGCERMTKRNGWTYKSMTGSVGKAKDAHCRSNQDRYARCCCNAGFGCGGPKNKWCEAPGSSDSLPALLPPPSYWEEEIEVSGWTAVLVLSVTAILAVCLVSVACYSLNGGVLGKRRARYEKVVFGDSQIESDTDCEMKPMRV